MKKLILLLAGLFIVSGVFAYTPTKKDEQLISGMSEKINNIMDKYPNNKKKVLGNKIVKKLDKYLKKYEKGGREYYIINNIKKNTLKRMGNFSKEVSKEEFLKAAEEGNIKKVKNYISNGRNIEVKSESNPGVMRGGTALMKASKAGNKEIVKLLIKNGANINAEDKYGRTALIYAVRERNKKIVKLLIENGADINAKEDGLYRETALMKASKIGSKEIAKLLIEEGADVNTKDEVGKTALMYALKGGFNKDRFKDVTRLLLENGANIDIKDNSGDTALDYVKSRSIDDAIKMLKKYQ